MLQLNNVKILGKVMNKNSDGQGGMGGGSFGNGGGKSNMLMGLLGNFMGKEPLRWWLHGRWLYGRWLHGRHGR